jgi:hypothetical protein
MLTGNLFFLAHMDQEGIVPINTFVYEDDRLKKIHFYVDDILQKFFKEKLENVLWLEDDSNFDPDEKEHYGYVYDERNADDKIELPSDEYEAAKVLVKALFDHSAGEMFLDKDGFTRTEFTVADIPEVPAPIDTDEPVDERFTVGEKVVDRVGRVFKYKGVLFDPLLPQQSEMSVTSNKDVYIGVDNDDYVRQTALDELWEVTEFEVYPLPLFASRYLSKDKKWFARASNINQHEGYGRTQEEAKNELMVKFLFGQKNKKK